MLQYHDILCSLLGHLMFHFSSFRAMCQPMAHRHAYYKYIAIAVILAASLEFPRFFEMRLEDGNGTWGKLQFSLYFFYCTKQGKCPVLSL